MRGSAAIGQDRRSIGWTGGAAREDARATRGAMAEHIRGLLAAAAARDWATALDHHLSALSMLDALGHRSPRRRCPALPRRCPGECWRWSSRTSSADAPRLRPRWRVSVHRGGTRSRSPRTASLQLDPGAAGGAVDTLVAAAGPAGTCSDIGWMRHARRRLRAVAAGLRFGRRREARPRWPRRPSSSPTRTGSTAGPRSPARSPSARAAAATAPHRHRGAGDRDGRRRAAKPGNRRTTVHQRVHRRGAPRPYLASSGCAMGPISSARSGSPPPDDLAGTAPQTVNRPPQRESGVRLGVPRYRARTLGSYLRIDGPTRGPHSKGARSWAFWTT